MLLPPNTCHLQQINCPIITDMTAEESDVDDAPLPTIICLCISSPKTSLSNYFPNCHLKQADGSSGRCQSPTGLTFISKRAGDVCQRDTKISEEAPLVHSGGVRSTSVHNNSVKCSFSSRVRWAKNKNGLVLSEKRRARKSEIGCHQRRFCSKPKLCQSCASDTSECFISWYKNQTDQSQCQVLQPGTRRTCPRSDLSAALSCMSLAIIGPFIRFQTQRAGASLHQLNHLSSSGRVGRWFPKSESGSARITNEPRWNLFEGNWTGWLQQWLFGAHVWVNEAPRGLCLEIQIVYIIW